MDKRLGEALGQITLLKEQLCLEREKTDEMLFQCGSLQGQIDELKPEAVMLREENSKSLKTIEDYRLKNERKTVQLEQQEEQLFHCEEKLETQDKKLEKQAKRMEEYRIALVELECKRDTLQGKLAESTSSCSQDSGQISDLLAENKEISKEFTKTKAELLDIKNESLKYRQEMEQTYGGVEKFVKPYLALADKVLSCASTKEKLQKFLPLDRMENQMKFIRQVGRDQGFATELYNGLRLHKSTTKEPLTDSERDLVDAVNVFYRLNDGYDYDVMVIPSRGDKFNKMMHQDLEKASSSAFLGFLEIYVPSLMSDEKTVTFKAIVKGKT